MGKPATKNHKAHDLESRLAAYALAAGALAAGLVCTTPQAEAEVVYTPVNASTSFGVIQLDIDNNGAYDFILLDHSFFTGSRSFPAIRRLVIGGSAFASVITNAHEADVLAPGDTIGSAQDFVNVHQPRLLLAGAKQFYGGSTGTCCWEGYGNWENVTDRYLGVKFQISGQNHYGWIRATVRTSDISVPWFLKIKVTGYAYESNPGQPIVAGDTGGGNAAVRGTLGALARGAAVSR